MKLVLNSERSVESSVQGDLYQAKHLSGVPNAGTDWGTTEAIINVTATPDARTRNAADRSMRAAPLQCPNEGLGGAGRCGAMRARGRSRAEGMANTQGQLLAAAGQLSPQMTGASAQTR